MIAEPAPGFRLADMSVVIPTFNAGRTLEACLACTDEAVGAEVIVVDGGSCDDTLAIARGHGVDVMSCERGRGQQLRAGAARASRSWLLFLHADTCPQGGWTKAVTAWASRPDAAAGFAVFTFRLDDGNWRARILERLVGFRARRLGLPYGDQGLIVHRELFQRIGGYADLELMEDVDLVRRLGRGRLTVLPAVAITSAGRWRRDGWMRRSLRNLACLALFQLGVSPQRIARFYAR